MGQHVICNSPLLWPNHKTYDCTSCERILLIIEIDALITRMAKPINRMHDDACYQWGLGHGSGVGQGPSPNASIIL